jgi:hypothetical protein
MTRLLASSINFESWEALAINGFTRKTTMMANFIFSTFQLSKRGFEKNLTLSNINLRLNLCY